MEHYYWNDGDPTEHGWYNASVYYAPLSLRYWDGSQWSGVIIANLKWTNGYITKVRLDKEPQSDIILWRAITPGLAEKYDYNHDTLRLIGKQ